MNRIRWTCTGALFVLSACGGPDQSTLPGLTVEEWDVQAVPTETRFLAVRDMFLSDGALWVLDGAPPFVTRLSLETGEVLQFGREGGGPGEFRAPWAIQPTSDSSGVLVWDFGSYRVTEFEPDGSVVSVSDMDPDGRMVVRSRFRDVSYADPHRVRATPDGFISASFGTRLEHTSDFARGVLRLSDQRFRSGKVLLRLSELVVPGIESMKEWGAMPFWDVCDGHLVVWDPSSSEVMWMNSAGRSVTQVPSELLIRPIEHGDIERYLERMARIELGPEYRQHDLQIRRMARSYRDRFATETPVVTDLRCEDRNTIWLRLFSTANDPLGRGSDWIRVDAQGFRGHRRAPPGFTPFLFTSAGYFGLLELPDGDQIIAFVDPSLIHPARSNQGDI